MKHRLILICLITIMMATGCKPRLPDGVLSNEEMENVLLDYHIAQGICELNGCNDDMRYRLMQAVFSKYEITEAEFDSSMLWYSANSEVLMEVYDRVNARLQSRLTQASDLGTQVPSKYANLASDGDTCNLWTFATHANVMPLPLQNMFRFSINADSTYRPGDTFIWHMQTTMKVQSNRSDIIMQLLVTYDNDSIQGKTRNIYDNGEAELELIPNDKHDSLNIRNISGFIYMPMTVKSQEADDFRLLMLSDMALIRMHKPLPDSLVVVPVPTDSLTTDSLGDDSVAILQPVEDRRTPDQVRDAKPHVSTINVQKIRPVKQVQSNKKSGRKR